MKLMTEDQNDIRWMNDPDSYGETGKTIRRIMDAGKWDEFLSIHADEDGIVDCDSLYDYLRYESGDALQDVGLHETEATATVAEVIAAWETQNAPAKVKRDENGKPQVSIYDGKWASLDMDIIDEDGDDDEVSLDNEKVAELIDNNANTGEWNCTDPETATFDAWIERR